MLQDLSSIKTIRINLGMSQKDLAKECGISGSMLNQIEKGGAKPGYDTARKIFDYLEKKQNSSQKKAGEICQKSLITLTKTNTIGDAIREMKKHGISQIPIFDSSKCKGIVTERGITTVLDNPKFDRLTKLSKIIESVPPIVSADFPANSLKNIINISKCILVTENDTVIGIITSQDLHKLIP